MVTRLSETWEKKDDHYNKLDKDVFEFNHLSLKSKIPFYNRKLQFGNKFQFIGGQTKKLFHELSLSHKCQNSNWEIIGTKDDVKLDFKTNTFKKDDAKVDLNFKAKIENLNDGSDVYFQPALEAYIKNNLFVSVGLQSWNIHQTAPQVLNLRASFLKDLYNSDNGKEAKSIQSTTVYSGLVNLNVAGHYLSGLQLFAKRYQDKSTSVLYFDLDRQVEKGHDVHAVSFGGNYTKQLCEKSQVGVSLKHDINSQKVEASIVGLYEFDKVKLNLRYSADRSISCAISSKLNDLTILACSSISLHSITSRVGSKVVTKYHGVNNFGLSLEFDRV